MKIDELKNRSVIILGLGKEGLSSYRFVREIFPDKIIALADKKPFDELSAEFRTAILNDKNIRSFLGKDYLDALKYFEVIIKSPGVNPRLYGIENALEKGAILTSNTKLFLKNKKGKVIGITGTKGKSTTATLIFEMLRRKNYKTSLIGNIGFSALDFLKIDDNDRLYVYELSSYQLEDFKESADWGIFVSFFPDHLDYHRSEEYYFEAKSHLFLNISEHGTMFFNGANKQIRKLSEKVKCKTVDFLEMDGKTLYKQIHGNSVKRIVTDEGFVIDKTRIKLLGEHNLENVVCAVKFALFMNVDREIIREVIENFTGLKHRLEFVGEYNGIKFFDDAISTTPESTIAAIKTFDGEISTLILGGKNRGYDFSVLAETILRHKIQNLILLPESGKIIFDEIKKKAGAFSGLMGFMPKHFFVTNMKKCVEKAYGISKAGKICLLSCASPSNSLFKNFEDKGDQFVRFIKELGQ